MKTKTVSELSEKKILQAVNEWSAVMETKGVHLLQEDEPGAVFWKGGNDRVTLLIRIYKADGTAWYNLEAGIVVVNSDEFMEIAAWCLREQAEILFPVRFRLDDWYNDDKHQFVVIGSRGSCDGITPAGMKDLRCLSPRSRDKSRQIFWQDGLLGGCRERNPFLRNTCAGAYRNRRLSLADIHLPCGHSGRNSALGQFRQYRWHYYRI